MSLHPDRTLGERIKKWRLEQGLIQKDLAKLIGVDEMTIVNWEKGRTKPIKQNIEKLEKILGNLPSS
jgi:transcriptional regulator with XRE-family HTH domain